MNPPTLTDDELRRLILSTLAKGPVDQREMMRVIEWAEQVKVDQAILQEALALGICLRCPGDEITLELLTPEEHMTVEGAAK